jgi:hypothetical protein
MGVTGNTARSRAKARAVTDDKITDYCYRSLITDNRSPPAPGLNDK